MAATELTTTLAFDGDGTTALDEIVAAAGGRAMRAGRFAFASASPALACAARIQQDRDGAVRIGIAADADIAAGLAARAGTGQVLVGHEVAAHAAARAGREFREAGSAAFELLWREPLPRTRIRMCGPLVLEIDGRDRAADLPGGQAGRLLGYLLTARDRSADRDELAAAVWPDHPPADVGASLRPMLSRIRRAIAPATLEGRERLRLDFPDPVWVDIDAAAEWLEAGRAAARGGDWDAAREHAGAAFEILDGRLLADVSVDWIDDRRRETEELALEALELVARAALALGPPHLHAAERAGRDLISRSPYRELGHRYLMEALAGAGNDAEALRVYDDLRVLLRDELGATPAPEIQALHQRLLAGEQAVVGPAPAPPRSLPLPRALSPRERSAFVAREGELAALDAAWADARAGRRRLVLLGGDPGVGKTRLTSEFARRAHADGAVLYAACQEEALVSYQPFVEALREYARSTVFDAARLAGEPGLSELARLVPEISAPANRSPADPETRRYLLCEAVSAMFADASAQAPVLLILDDLHWADHATLRLLRHLMRAPTDAALLIVGTYREADVAAGHPLAALLADLRRDRLFERVSLEGLDAAAVGDLIAAHTGQPAPATLVDAVHDQTDGNPFFVEEVLRHLIETGVVVERAGRWTSALSSDEMGVPEGVKDVIDGRLGRLSADARSLLAHGAVLGREFRFAQLLAMAEQDEETVIAALDEAAAAQLIAEVPGRAEPTYSFTHALVRETLYGGLSRPRRERLHARAAAAIEVDGDVAALAVHQCRAGAAGDPAKAIECSLAAAAAARELAAWEEAIRHLDGAREVMERLGGRERERAQLLTTIGELMAVAGDLSRQIEAFDQALVLWDEIGDAERAAQAHSRLGMSYSLIDSIDGEHLDIGLAFEHFNAARAVLKHGPARKALGHLEAGIATAHVYGMRMRDGRAAAERGMEIAEQVGDDVLWTGAAQAWAWHAIGSGDLAAGFSLLERTFTLADRHRRPFLAFMACTCRGQLSWCLGAPDEAQAWFERPPTLPYIGPVAFRGELADALGRCEASRGEFAAAHQRLRDAVPAWITHSLAPIVGLWEGRLDAVAALAADTLASSRRTGNRWDEAMSHHLAGRVQHLRGDADAAADAYADALPILVDGDVALFEQWVRRDAARAEVARGDLGAARAHVDCALNIVGNGEDWRGATGSVALADAVTLAHEGRVDEAMTRFAAAYEIFEDRSLRADAADALQEWGHALALAGDHDAAEEKREAARTIYRECGAAAVWIGRAAGD